MTPRRIAAGRKYLAYTLGAGQCLLVLLVWLQQLVPGATFQPGGVLAGNASTGELVALCFLGIMGVGVKAAIMPLHGWLPAAMVAPTPVSALLHAVAVVKAGTFGCVRLIHYRLWASRCCTRSVPIWSWRVAGGATVLLASHPGPRGITPQAPSRLFDRQSTVLYRAGGRPRAPQQHWPARCSTWWPMAA